MRIGGEGLCLKPETVPHGGGTPQPPVSRTWSHDSHSQSGLPGQVDKVAIVPFFSPGLDLAPTPQGSLLAGVIGHSTSMCVRAEVHVYVVKGSGDPCLDSGPMWPLSASMTLWLGKPLNLPAALVLLLHKIYQEDLLHAKGSGGPALSDLGPGGGICGRGWGVGAQGPRPRDSFATTTEKPSSQSCQTKATGTGLCAGAGIPTPAAQQLLIPES